MTQGLLKTVDTARDFLLGGKAFFTLRSIKTRVRYTYRVKEAKYGKKFFVSVMDGSDNEVSYKYLGMIEGQSFKLTKASKLPVSDPKVQAISWITNNLLIGKNLPSTVEFWHEGKCACCGRKLTVPESIERGIGPECFKNKKG